MNKFIDWIISNLKYIGNKSQSYLMDFFNKTQSLINNNFTISKMYKPIIEEKINTNKKLQETLKLLNHKNNEAEKNILKLQNENTSLQSKYL